MAGPCFDFQIKDKNFGLKPEEIRPIWEYAKSQYLDRGVSFEDTILALSKQTGAPPRFFAEAFSGPKSQRIRTAEIYKVEDARRNAINDAKNFVRSGDTPAVIKAIRAVSELPRASLTALHGGVFPVTHGGGLLLRPREWINFAKGFKVSWTSLSDKAYRQARLDLLADPQYAYARQSGLKINPDEGPQGVLTGWLTSGQGWSRKAWLGLQRMRLEVFKSDLSRYAPEFRTKELGQNLAEIANHATGVTEKPLGPIGKTMFAPQLTASKFMRAFVDPAKTLNTFGRMISGLGKEVTPGERAAAYTRLGNAAEFIGFTYGALLLNQALINSFGSKQKINFTDPTKADWMRFKTGNGYVMATRGPEEMLRLLGHLIAIGTSSKKDLRGQSPTDTALQTVARAAQYKIAPGLQTIGEGLYGRDTFGRPLPPPIQSIRKAIGLQPQLATPKKPQFTTGEYLFQKGPIFIGGGARDVYESLRQQGLSHPDAMMLFRGALVSAGEFAGFGAYRETTRH